MGIFWNLNEDLGYPNFTISESYTMMTKTWTKMSEIVTSTFDDTNYFRIDFNHNYDNENSMRYDDILVVDLTETLDFNSAPFKYWSDDEFDDKLKAWCDANLEYGVTEVVVPTN